MSAPVLSGDLRVFPLLDVLLLINTSHKSGTLRCMQPGGAKTVEWENGEIVFAVQLLTLDPAQAAPVVVQHADDADLERAIEQYGGAVAMLLARASAAGPGEAARLRRRLREATFEQADLLKEMAIDPDGRIDRRVLLANVADFPPGQRARVLQGALERLLRLLLDELKGKVSLDDVTSALEPEE